MAVVINTIDDNKFSVNGVSFLRRYVSTVLNDVITIKNSYTSEILTSGNYADFIVNGATFGTAALVQDALVVILFNPLMAGLSNDNIIINGNFSINQREYVSGQVTGTNNQYTLDRWTIISQGGAVTYSANINDSGRLVVVPSNVYFRQLFTIEESGIYTLSYFGTSTCYVNGVVVTNGMSFTLSFNVLHQIVFINGTVSRVKIEKGKFSTPFYPMPYATELILCKRYFERVGVPNGRYVLPGLRRPFFSFSFLFSKKNLTRVESNGRENNNLVRHCLESTSN